MIDIETNRLMLRLVPLAALASSAAEMVEVTRGLIGEKLPDAWFHESWIYKTRYDQWVADPSFAPWSVRTVTLKDSGQIVGGMNCHHKPMPFTLSGKTGPGVEMGYSIFEPWQRHGIAFEAIMGFLAWARTQGLESVVLCIRPDNVASLALARKLGAVRIGSQLDEKGCSEDIYHFRC
jgi:RimJ/RimL family protein N-acetyltransferase